MLRRQANRIDSGLSGLVPTSLKRRSWDQNRAGRRRIWIKYLVLSLMALGTLNATILPKNGIATSNFLWFGLRWDVSAWIRFFPHCNRRANYWKSPTLYCTFDLCNILHEGGEGRLVRGTCTEQARTDRVVSKPVNTTVLLKTIKGNPMFQGAAYREARAVQHMSSQDPTSLLKAVGSHGINYLMITQLDGYIPVRVGYKSHFTLQQKNEFLFQMIEQVLKQLRHLHSKYLHLDLHYNNILVRKTGTTEWHFLLIDFSSSLSITHVDRSVRRMFRDKPFIPRLTPTLCLSRRPGRSVARAGPFCRGQQSSATTVVCPPMLDTYPLGIIALWLISDKRLPWTLPGPSFTVQDGVEATRKAIDYLQGLRKEETLSPDTANEILRLIDVAHPNATLVCE